jgi:hypothetical protein
MNDKRLKKFRKELEELLEKYDATIILAADPSADWGAVTGLRFEVNFGYQSENWQQLLDMYATNLSAYELKLMRT